MRLQLGHLSFLKYSSISFLMPRPLQLDWQLTL